MGLVIPALVAAHGDHFHTRQWKNTLDNGLKANNTQNESGVLAELFQNNPTGTPYLFPQGEYRFDSEFSLSDGDGFPDALANKFAYLQGMGPEATKFIVAAGSSTTRPWRIGGQIVAPDWPYSDPLVWFAQLAVTANRGEKQLTTTANVNLPAGQWLMLCDTESTVSSSGNRVWRTHEKVQVAAAVSGSTTIPLKNALKQTHLTSSGGIVRQNPASVYVSDIGFYCEDGSPYPMRADRLINSVFRNITLVGDGTPLNGAGFFTDSLNVTMEHVWASGVEQQWDIAKLNEYVSMYDYHGETTKTDRNSAFLLEERNIGTKLRDIFVNGRIVIGNDTINAKLHGFDVRRLDLTGKFGFVGYGTCSEICFVTSITSTDPGTAVIHNVEIDDLDIHPTNVGGLSVYGTTTRVFHGPPLEQIDWDPGNIIMEPENSSIGV